MNSPKLHFTWMMKQTIMMVGLPRQPIKSEGCGEEGHSIKEGELEKVVSELKPSAMFPVSKNALNL